MSKFAIDVALLFSKDTERNLIDLNHSLKQNYSHRRIYLNKENCFPHISLFMGVINYGNIDRIGRELEQVSKKFNHLNLEIEKLNIENLPVKEGVIKISGFEIKENDVLKNLHEKIADKIKGYIKKEIKKGYLFNPNEIDKKDTPWMFPYIKNFVENSSYENFKSHITIGDGTLEKELKLPINFTALRLAICHLGNYCTCRKVLYETNLRNN